MTPDERSPPDQPGAARHPAEEVRVLLFRLLRLVAAEVARVWSRGSERNRTRGDGAGGTTRDVD